MSVKKSVHAYEVRPRKDKRGVDLISDLLPFGRLWYAYAQRRSDFRMYFLLMPVKVCTGAPSQNVTTQNSAELPLGSA